MSRRPVKTVSAIIGTGKREAQRDLRIDERLGRVDPEGDDDEGRDHRDQAAHAAPES